MGPFLLDKVYCTLRRKESGPGKEESNGLRQTLLSDECRGDDWFVNRTATCFYKDEQFHCDV